MKVAIAIISAAITLFGAADTNAVAAARAKLDAARAEYRAACLAAGITNTARRASRRTATPSVSAVGSSSKILTKKQRNFFENRRIAVSRDIESIPGSVITTWWRNGRPDTENTVVTNVLRRIVGHKQCNPLHDLAERMSARAEATSARLDLIRSVLEDKRTEYAEKKDKAALATTKAIYQAMIDTIDRLLLKIDVVE